MRMTRMAAQVFGVVALAVGCLGVATTESKAGEFHGGGYHSGYHGGGYHPGFQHGGGYFPGYHGYGGGFRPGYGYGGYRPGWGWGYRPGYGGWYPRVGIPPIYRLR